MSKPQWEFAAQRGFFSHDDDSERWDFRATTRLSLGLLERKYPTDDSFWARELGKPCENLSQTQWRRFRHYVETLNVEDPEDKRYKRYKRYKLFYIIRHGLGVHNAKKTQVGREAWSVSRFAES
jgi:hypothetical protein